MGFLIVSWAADIIKKHALFLYKLLGIFYGDLVDSIPKHTRTVVNKPALSCRTRFTLNSNYRITKHPLNNANHRSLQMGPFTANRETKANSSYRADKIAQVLCLHYFQSGKAKA